ncbi:MAG: sensor histidine kinase [Salinibacter sp.]|uniref:sensor histidine kinase n=1 Tax=Salinibacter sp. TaxID=2065818 RepID=UPI0035D497A9
MSTALLGTLSVFRPSGMGLSREVRSKIATHRLLSLLGAFFVLLFGPLYAVSNPSAVDPVWARCGVALLFIVLFVGSYVVEAVCRRYVEWMRGVIYVLMAWFATVTVANGFAGNYALGLLLVFAVLAVVVGLGVETGTPAFRFLGFGVAFTGGGALLGPEPQISLPILLVSMATVGIVGGIVIQAQIEIREEIREAKEKAQEANRLKTAMLANMSHELRTPLTAINGFAEVLKNNLEGQMQHFAESIYRSGQRLLQTLRSVLRLSQLEAGTFELESEPVDLAETARETARRLEPEAEEHQVALRANLPEDPAWAEADDSATVRITENLLENAIKFTPEGGAVEVRVYEENEEGVLEIEDTGIGIEEAAIPKVFEPFRQESEGLDREYEGTGLGLPITKELVDSLGGSIEISTEKGEGTCFTVRLPRKQDASSMEDS